MHTVILLSSNNNSKRARTHRHKRVTREESLKRTPSSMHTTRTY